MPDPYQVLAAQLDAARQQIAKRDREIERLRDALGMIRSTCYDWTMGTPLEIVTHGGVAYAVPITEIYQHADAALAPKEGSHA